jgi:hypothetical protein
VEMPARSRRSGSPRAHTIAECWSVGWPRSWATSDLVARSPPCSSIWPSAH